MKYSKKMLAQITVSICFLISVPFSVVFASSLCSLGGGNFTYGGNFALGPNMYSILSQQPDVMDAIRAGRDVWDVTDARDRIGDWDGSITSRDCSSMTSKRQLGAWNFADPSDQNNYCLTMLPNNIGSNVLAFVDYYSNKNCFPPRCGTRSVLVNLRYSFSTNPLPGQYDIVSVAAHEFGHVLGLAHAISGVCSSNIHDNCSYLPAQETMSPYLYGGETCKRSLESHDIQNANTRY